MHIRWRALLLACLFLLAGCSEKQPPAPTNQSAQTPPTEAPVVPPAVKPPAEKPETPPASVPQSEALEEFRRTVDDADARIAAAHLGYVELAGYADLAVYLEANGFYEKYPFLSELTEERFVKQAGCELYVIVPMSADTALTVRDCSEDEKGYTMVRGDVLLQLEAGEPVILQGNVSDIVSNLWVTVETAGREPLEYTPYLSLMDGRLARVSDVYDFTDYEHLWHGAGVEDPAFLGSWYTRTVDGEGRPLALKLSLRGGGGAEYSYGIPDIKILESFSGRWSESGGVLKLTLTGGPAGYTYDLSCTMEWEIRDFGLYLRQTDGGVLLSGTEGVEFEFLPFDPYRLAGTWSAAAQPRDWRYDLDLKENGVCRFTVSPNGAEPACYEGWWHLTEDDRVSFGVELISGQHPESPELTYVYGLYRVETVGESMLLRYEAGEILTLNMEEDTYETFTQTRSGSCVVVRDADAMAVDWSSRDSFVADDMPPVVRAAFCAMLPVEDFTVVALSLQDGPEIKFDAAELYEYGALTPGLPLKVTLTIPGTIPAYGVSFTDPSGAERLFGVTVSGLDGSLELTEIR